ncbi:MAG: ketopantoate reductase family protein [Thermoplasmatota archaeon]
MTRILVIGPGALGIPTAIRLHNAGHDVLLAVRNKEKAERLEAIGLTMTAPDGGQETATVACVHDPAQLADVPVDLLIHTTKCSVAADVLRHWLAALAPDGHVIPFQNGLMAGELQPIAGDRYVECSVYWPATLTKVGHSHMTGPGHQVLGPYPKGEPGPEHQELARLLGAVTPTEAHADMQAVKWSKLTLNSAMTCLGVATGATMREMMAHKPTRAAFLAVIREGLAVMAAQGIQPVAIGNSKPGLLSRLPDPVAHLVLRLLARKYGDYRSSSTQSLARGEPTEVPYLNGVIVAAGQEYGVATPVNAGLVEAVARVEAGQVKSGFGLVEQVMGA